MKRSSSTAGSSGQQPKMPLRVPVSKSLFQTPQTKDRGTFGKLSGHEPPGTSESTAGPSRMSAGAARSSQCGVFGTEKIKDPRPLHDKAFVQQCIKQLCEFLIQNGYPHHVSVKSLQSPSVKDFLKIFTFINQFFCPSYELPGSKFEEEIPRVFKALGYPFALSKSSLYTVGAPHTWPQIVAALVWLIDCVKIYTALKENGPSLEDVQSWGGETDEGIVHKKLFLDYAVKCYEQFMKGATTFEEQDAEVESKLKDLFAVDELQIKALAAENKRLNEEIARLEKEKEREPDLRERLRNLKTSLQADVQKFQTYFTSMESHGAILDQKIEGVNKEIEAAELEVEAMKQENARLQRIVDNQKYSVVDIERRKQETKELQQTINKLTKEVEAEERQLWNEEMKYARKKEEVWENPSTLREYQKLARKLKLILVSAENSRGHDFEIQLNPSAGPYCLLKYGSQIK
ncbi:NDC80 protein, partial [Thinocorus orbignyianus]|nr:NDC80 protein [Thinocorus orbignyianus]